MTNPLLNKNIIHHDIDFNNIKPEHFVEAFSILLPEIEKEHEYLMSEAPLVYEDMFENAPYQEQLMSVLHILHSLNLTVQTNDIKNIAEEYLPKISAVFKKMQLDDRGYIRLKEYKLSNEYQCLESIKKKMIEDIIFNYEMGGINLPQEQKDELQSLAYQLAEKTTEFENNLTEVEATLEKEFFKEELKGLSERALGNAQISGDKLLVSESSGLYDDILKNCEVESTRKAVYEDSLRVGIAEGFDNRPILEEILKLRQQYAKILGFDTYANSALVKRMVKTPQEALEFINQLGNQAYAQAKSESESIKQASIEILGKEPDFHDRAYVVTQMKKQLYKVEQEVIRQYFPVEHTVNGLLQLIENLYDITFTVNKDKATWHEDVIVYDLQDKTTQKPVGSLYMDLYKRKFKSSGAWMSSAVSRDVYKDKTKLPVAYIVCNAPKDTHGQSTFEFNEIVTLFHEMGHALHHLLTEVDTEYYSGLNGVQHDAVELPSQFMENFVWDYEIIKLISSHITTGEVLPKEEFDKMVNMKNFLSASGLIRQIIFSELDMRLYSQNDVVASQIENEVFDKWLTRPRDKREFFLPSFSHIFAGGYSAGYYAYKWAEVLSADSFAALKEVGDTYHDQKVVANKFRKLILAQGGAENMEDNFMAFRGRNPDVKYLLKDLGITI